MAPITRRRSSRLNANDTPSRSFASKLGSLFERDETPKQERSINAMVTTPAETRLPGSFGSDDSLIKTPKTANRMNPSHKEMHPSKLQQSTEKAPDLGLRLGFTDIKKDEKASVKAVESTPTKSKLPASPSGFDFKWAHPESELGAETQRIMDSIREEAAKIKEQMVIAREEQERKDEEADQMRGMSGRKIAKPKGRFSDAHKAEFSKMDSIANHVSTWKNKLQASSSKVNLKRTQSRANLDLPKLQHPEETQRLENLSPGKRVKTRFHDDVSTARPSSSGTGSSIPRSSIARPRSSRVRPVSKDGLARPGGLPSAVTTPTQASLARAASVQALRASKHPSLSRSKSTKDLTSPAAQKAEGGNKYFAAISRAPSMKSILHKAQPKFSDDPVKIAAGTHLPIWKSNPRATIEKETPSLIGTPHSTLNRSPTLKRVGFNLSKKPSTELGTNPGSPSKIPSAPISRNIGTSPSKLQEKVSYPALRKPIPGGLTSNPPTPGDFTFRSSKPVRFGPATSGLTSPTIRRVRPSGIATPAGPFDSMPTVPHGMPNKKRRRADDNDDEDIENVPPGQEAGAASPAKKQRSEGNAGKVGAGGRPGDGRRKFVEKFMADKSKKVGISLSKLNAMARPKARR